MISFWATFRDIWRFFSGHNGDEQPDRPHSETCLESCHACAAEFWANPSLFIVSFRAFLIPISNIISIMQIEKKRRWFAWDSNPGLQMHRRMELWWPPMCSWIYFWFVTNSTVWHMADTSYPFTKELHGYLCMLDAVSTFWRNFWKIWATFLFQFLSNSSLPTNRGRV